MTSDQATRDLAAQVLTPRQLAIWKLYDAGDSIRRIAVSQGIATTTVRDILARAQSKINQAKENAA